MGEKGLVGRETGQTKLDLLHEEAQMSRKDWPGLLNRHPVPLLFLGTSLDPILDLHRIARIGDVPTAKGVENSPKHPDIGVHHSRSEMARATAVKKATQAKMRAGEDMNLRASRLIAAAKETDDIQRGRQLQRRGRRPRSPRDGPNAQELLEVGPQTILLRGVLHLTDKLAKLRMAAVKVD